MEWQTIETAPRDRRILVWNGFFGVYSSQYTVERDDNGLITWTGYPLGLTSIGFGRWYCVPTFWKLLPDPPKVAQGKEAE